MTLTCRHAEWPRTQTHRGSKGIGQLQRETLNSTQHCDVSALHNIAQLRNTAAPSCVRCLTSGGVETLAFSSGFHTVLSFRQQRESRIAGSNWSCWDSTIDLSRQHYTGGRSPISSVLLSENQTIEKAQVLMRFYRPWHVFNILISPALRLVDTRVNTEC